MSVSCSWLDNSGNSGVSHTLGWGVSLKENSGMSLCFSVVYGDAVYVAADSRSSFVKRNDFGGVEDCLIETDEYHKIVHTQINNENVLLLSTGQNKFSSEQKTFADIVKDITTKEYEDIIDFISDIRNTFLKHKLHSVNLDITVFFEKQQHLYCYFFPDSIQEANFHILNPQRSNILACWHGVNWAKAVFEHSQFDKYFVSEERVIAQINAVYDKIERLSCEFNNTVGGPIHIGKLAPDGFTWLQNGYEL